MARERVACRHEASEGVRVRTKVMGATTLVAPAQGGAGFLKAVRPLARRLASPMSMRSGSASSPLPDGYSPPSSPSGS